MPWWKSNDSRSSSSSKRHSADESFFTRIFSVQGRGYRSHLQRMKKLRHVNDVEIGGPGRLWRSPSIDHDHHYSSSRSYSVEPQPLPLPELAMLLLRDDLACANLSNANPPAGSVPLPSPPIRGFEEKERSGLVGDLSNDIGSKPSTSHVTSRNSEHTETQRVLNDIERHLDGGIAISAPASLYSSPARSPTRQFPFTFTSNHNHPRVQVWSSPEMPASEMNQGFFFQMLSEKAACDFPQTPKISPPRHARNLSGETFLLRENNVHPLPLPPEPTFPVPNSQVSPRPEMIPISSQWNKGKLLGRGTFGSVYCASNRGTGALCAMKEVDLFPDDPKSAESIKQLEQEIEVLSMLKHHNIVQYYGSEVVGEKFYIYLEYVHPGSINKYVREHCGSITESIIRNFTRHILSGLAYLHSKKTIHRDIKGANLLVDAHGVVKLADFGMAKHLAGPLAELSLKGSPYWMAPELIQSVAQKDASSDLAFAIDIWSLGCTIIEMMNGKPPWSEFEGAAAMFRALKENPPIPETLSLEGKDFLQCCFLRNPAERPTATALLDHPFVKNSQQLDIQNCAQALSETHFTDNALGSGQLFEQRSVRLILPPDISRGRPANK
ncbi:mitogen-activated protein kinase kinase kinase 5 [Impatiens glandulifera]|uniref:mitogen-activated protein kinase kinase kinase 5 n=1 Tax=Impatiens glandulifera TaxID=253017 RepID=UPI001FB0E30E|nr:mitogen-activated protein kinase kinase kinase 5 [Impatiens glandulifera]